MRTFAVALVILVFLSGCAGDAKEEPSASAPGDGDAPGSSDDAGASASSAANSSRSDNTPPSANITAANVTGPAPLNITFLLEGSDIDEDDLTWSLDADGDGEADSNGTSLPSNATFTYSDPGEFLANLTVSDGNASTSTTLPVNVTGLATTPAAIQSFSASYRFGAEGCGSWAAYDTAGEDPGAPAGNSLNGTTRVQFAVEPLTIGRTYTAVFTFDQGYLFLEVAYYDGDDGLIESNVVDTPNFGGATMTGTVPLGAIKGVIFACGGPSSASVAYSA